MQKLSEYLKNKPILLADGAMGTMLFQRGLAPGDCPEKINMERPEVLAEIAQLYLEAGSEIIQTNTFGGTSIKLKMYSLENKTKEINARAVQALRKIVGEQAYVSASCGPTGRLLEPFGDAKPEQIFDTYKHQMEILISEGVDMICIETMTDIKEATLAVKAARSISASIPICATMTFDLTPRGFFTIMGNTVEQAARELDNAGANIIGSNCGNGIVNMVAIAREFKKHTTLPLIIQSNAGIPKLNDGELVYTETPDFMAEKSRELINLGVKILGGCCGTTPAHISSFRKIIDEYPSKYFPEL